MATLTATKRTLPAPHPARDRARILRLEAATTTQTGRERALAEARAREARARRKLGLALARAEQTYAQAVRSLEEFDEYLRAVRARLDHAGYLSSGPARTVGVGLKQETFEAISFSLDLVESRAAGRRRGRTLGHLECFPAFHQPHPTLRQGRQGARWPFGSRPEGSGWSPARA